MDPNREDSSGIDADDTMLVNSTNQNIVLNGNASSVANIGNREYVINISTRFGNGSFAQKAPVIAIPNQGMATYSPL